MIHHASIPARDPQHVATVLAELIGGKVYPFPPLKGAFFVVSGDPRGTMIEVYPHTVQLDPEKLLSTASPPAPYHPFHMLLSVPLERDEIESITEREGWKTEFIVAGFHGKPPAFHLYRCWVENRLLIELVPQSMIGEYEGFMQFARLDALGIAEPVYAG
jgi:hypothetical protein